MTLRNGPIPLGPPATHTIACPRSIADFRQYSGKSGFSNPQPFTAETRRRIGGCAAAKKFSSPSSLPVSSRSSTTLTSEFGAVLRALYGLTEIGFEIAFPESTSVIVTY